MLQRTTRSLADNSLNIIRYLKKVTKMSVKTPELQFPDRGPCLKRPPVFLRRRLEGQAGLAISISQCLWF